MITAISNAMLAMSRTDDKIYDNEIYRYPYLISVITTHNVSDIPCFNTNLKRVKCTECIVAE